MKDKYLNIRIESGLKEQVIKLAQEERRSISDQAIYLIERGLYTLRRNCELATFGHQEQWIATNETSGQANG
ncbi:MAG: hypothetical protein LBD79_05735 [Treponema sp.]|jgi:hypothetical protein|nr:hypothetical protein [Treponema sp.]